MPTPPNPMLERAVGSRSLAAAAQRDRWAAADRLRHPWGVDRHPWRRLLDSSILMICILVQKLVGY
jgi:hypothetical protein